MCTGEVFVKTFVAATSHSNSVLFDFLQLVAVTKLCCGDKDFHKILQYTQSDLWLQHVALPCC